jgi:hypothetical protein
VWDVERGQCPQCDGQRWPTSIYQAIEELNGYLGGVVSCLRIQEFHMLFKGLGDWIRSRLRSMQMKKIEDSAEVSEDDDKGGFKAQQAHRVWVMMNKWQSVKRREVPFVMDLKWFRKQGLIFLHDFRKNKLLN